MQLRRQALSDAITTGKRQKKELELIIKAESQREEVANQLRKIGTVSHYYGLIPYLALKCDADYADILNKAASGAVSSEVFEKSFRTIIPAITAIDVSSRLKIPRSLAAVARPRVKSALWNLEAIGAYEARNYGEGQGVNVAVIDTGIDYTHSQLVGRFGDKKGHDFVGNSEEPMDKNGHGTHVAGTIASIDYGVATGCTLYAVRVLNSDGSGSEADAIAGIEWCIKNNIDVANMSFGSEVASRALEEICGYAWQNGLILVAAAGNNGYGPSYPAAFGDSVIAVAAVDEDLKHADFSNIYETNDISAPGVDIVSTYLGGGVARLSGTSMAAPHVTGSLALAKSINQDANFEEAMKSTANSLGEPDVYGAGLVNVNEIAKHLAGSKSEFSLPRSYSQLEKSADRAFDGFVKDATAELKRWFS